MIEWILKLLFSYRMPQFERMPSIHSFAWKLREQQAQKECTFFLTLSIRRRGYSSFNKESIHFIFFHADSPCMYETRATGDIHSRPKLIAVGAPHLFYLKNAEKMECDVDKPPAPTVPNLG